MLRVARPETLEELHHLYLLAVAPDHRRELAGAVARPVVPRAKFVIGSAVWLFSHPGHMVAGMCNDYRSHVDLDTIRRDFSEIRIRIHFPEGAPNLQPRDDIRITENAAIIRPDGHPGMADLVERPWSWPERGRPVYNFRSENREFTNGRCLIVADGFYEFTPHTDPKSKRKHKWLFTKTNEPWFCIAGIWRTSEVGEAFTMLTTAPGPDVAPYHERQVAVLDRANWARWLDPSVSAKIILKPLPPGSLRVEQVT